MAKQQGATSIHMPYMSTKTISCNKKKNNIKLCLRVPTSRAKNHIKTIQKNKEITECEGVRA